MDISHVWSQQDVINGWILFLLVKCCGLAIVRDSQAQLLLYSDVKRIVGFHCTDWQMFYFNELL